MYILDQKKEFGFKVNDSHVFRVEESDSYVNLWIVTVNSKLLIGADPSNKCARIIGFYEDETRAKEVLCDLLADLAAGDVPFKKMPEE